MITEKLKNIIEALGRHQDIESIKVLEEFGTNSEDKEVRALTAQALIRKNVHESLKLMILERGKGINDLNSEVALATLNEMVALKDKTEMMKIINDTIEMNSDNAVRENAQSIKTLIALS